MKKAFKLEFIVAKGLTNKLIDFLEQVSIKEYTVIDIDKGKGNKDGEVNSSSLNANSNVYVFVICEEDRKDKAVELIQPFFKIAGGIFILSEVTVIDP